MKKTFKFEEKKVNDLSKHPEEGADLILVKHWEFSVERVKPTPEGGFTAWLNVGGRKLCGVINDGEKTQVCYEYALEKFRMLAINGPMKRDFKVKVGKETFPLTLNYIADILVNTALKNVK